MARPKKDKDALPEIAAMSDSPLPIVEEAPLAPEDREAHEKNLASAKEKLAQGVGHTDLRLVEQIAILRDEQEHGS